MKERIDWAFKVLKEIDDMIKIEEYYVKRAKEEGRNLKVFQYSSELLQQLKQKIQDIQMKGGESNG